MRTQKKFIPFLYFFLLTLVLLLYVIVFVDPNSMPRIGGFFFSPLYFFFPLIFLTSFFLSAYLMKHIRRAIWIGLFMSSLFILRGFGFTNFLYIFLIGLIFLLTEAAITKGFFTQLKSSLRDQGKN